jgi:hypothetical protein
VACYGLSPTFKGSSQGIFCLLDDMSSFVEEYDSGPLFADVVSRIGLCVLALNSFSMPEESQCFSFYPILYILPLWPQHRI